MVYLNSSANYRNKENLDSNTEFENEIIGVGIDYDQTLYFSDSRFSQSNYPQPGSVGNFSKFKDRRFEPNNKNNYDWHSSWNVSGNGDWYKVYKGNQSEIDNIFELGVKNGEKGDFFRIITKCGISNLH